MLNIIIEGYLYETVLKCSEPNQQENVLFKILLISLDIKLDRKMTCHSSWVILSLLGPSIYICSYVNCHIYRDKMLSISAGAHINLSLNIIKAE